MTALVVLEYKAVRSGVGDMAEPSTALSGAAPQRLRTNSLGVPGVVFFVMCAATPLTVVGAVVPTGIAVTGRVDLPVAFVAVGVVLALFCVGYVAMAGRIRHAGGFYAFVSRGLGRPLGVGAAWVALLAYNGLQVGLYGAIGAAAGPLLQSWLGVDVAWWVFALVAWVLVAVLGLLNVTISRNVLGVLLLGEVAVIVVYAVANLLDPAGGTVPTEPLDPANLLSPGVGAILALAVLGFVGFEATTVFAEESRGPDTVRHASYLTVAVIAVLYGLSSWGTVAGAGRAVEAARASGPDLIFQLASARLGSGLVEVGRILFVTSILAAMVSFHLTTARYFFALGRERVCLPAGFGRTSPRTGAPVAGSLVQSGIGLVVIVGYAVGGWDPVVHLFFAFGTSGGLGVLLLIAVTALAVLGYFARHPSGETLWRRRVAPALAAVAVAVVLFLVVANFGSLLGVDDSSPLRWGVPGLFAVVGIAGVGWGLAVRARDRARYDGIGLGSLGEDRS